LAKRLRDETGRGSKSSRRISITRLISARRKIAAHRRSHHAAGQQCGRRCDLAAAWLDVDKMDDMITLNVGALTRLTYALRQASSRVRRHDHQHRFDRRVAPEILNGVYAEPKRSCWPEPVAPQGACRQERAHSGCSARRNGYRFLGTAGLPVEHLPGEIVMRADDMVDAALRSRSGELIPSRRFRKPPIAGL